LKPNRILAKTQGEAAVIPPLSFLYNHVKIRAHLSNGPNKNDITLQTNDREHSIVIPPRAGGGSDVNGGELLFLALASCFCNDLYREAAKMGLHLEGADVEVEGVFGGPGDRASNVVYRVQVHSNEPVEKLQALIAHTDSVAEIHKTPRSGIHVSLELDDEN
jgi:organic hydroperoxide reductase OsmC/OhrA